MSFLNWIDPEMLQRSPMFTNACKEGGGAGSHLWVQRSLRCCMVAMAARTHLQRLVHREGLKAREVELGGARRPRARWDVRDGVSDRFDVWRRAPAAAPGEVQVPVGCELEECLAHRSRRVVVAAHSVGQTSVRVAEHEAVRAL
jgi:hypothetical protein